MHTIPLSYNPMDIPALTSVLAKYQDVDHNQLIHDFEQSIAALTGRQAVALNSGTSAIHLAMKLLGVGPGDTILAPTFTYIATVNPARYLGANPVFIDSVPDTWNMDPELLRKALQETDRQGNRPKAIVVVHTYGMPSAMDEILRQAEAHNIPVIEDAAESFGSLYKGRLTGTFGRIGVYSFNNNKTFTTYGGGMLLTADPVLAQKARFLAAQAREDLPYYAYRESGFNYRMGPLQAAYGLSQLPAVEETLTRRRTVWETYRTALAGRGIEFQAEAPGVHSNRWFSTILLKDQATRLAVTGALAVEGIETRPLWKPLHTQPLFSGAQAYLSGVSGTLFERGLCLPSGTNLSAAEQDKVIAAITRA